MARSNPFGEKGWTPERVGNLTGKTYAVTGANAGVGHEAAKVLLSKGAAVVMLNRSAPRSDVAIAELKEEVGANADVRLIRMDLADLASVRRAAERMNVEVPHIDAFISNAAIAQVATRQFTKDVFENQLGTNHYGHFLLTGLIFDPLAASKARIVIVGSNGHRMSLKRVQFEDMNFDGNCNAHVTHCHSKFAQMMFAYELERRVKAAGLPVPVHVCHPGMAMTKLVQEKSRVSSSSC